MTCLEVRDLLSEHSLGLLDADQRRLVDRHLEWCPGCRKEWSELQEAIVTLTAALPPADPSPSLGERVVRRIARARSGERPDEPRGARPHRRGMVALRAATVAAVLVAVVSTGWAMSEHNSAKNVRRAVAARPDILHRYAQVARELEQLQAGGVPYHVQLLPTKGVRSAGQAVIVTAPGANNTVIVDIVPPAPDTGPYTVQVVTRTGRVLALGQLGMTTNGDLLLVASTPQNLSQVITVSILDRHSNVVLTGTPRLYGNS